MILHTFGGFHHLDHSDFWFEHHLTQSAWLVTLVPVAEVRVRFIAPFSDKVSMVWCRLLENSPDIEVVPAITRLSQKPSNLRASAAAFLRFFNVLRALKCETCITVVSQYGKYFQPRVNTIGINSSNVWNVSPIVRSLIDTAVGSGIGFMIYEAAAEICRNGADLKRIAVPRALTC
uniref:Uncharacterized protein n=1 Tax=Timspurckia oligopyrenoides TaxID=708627 RepID=A0A7S0ZKJ8_9RHOD